MTKIKLAVFDLSGTTVNDHNAVANSLWQAATEAGLEVTLDDFQQSIGTNKIHMYQYLIAKNNGMQVSLRHLEQYHFPDFYDQAVKLFERYSKIMIDYYQHHLQAMDGTEEVFDWCRTKDIKIATDTGFHREINDAIQQGLKWVERQIVDLAVDIDHVKGIGRPAPFMIFHIMKELNIQSVHEVIKIGDTPADLYSGFHAGCKGNIGVLSGANTEEVLIQHPHTHIINSILELPRLIENHFNL